MFKAWALRAFALFMGFTIYEARADHWVQFPKDSRWEEVHKEQTIEALQFLEDASDEWIKAGIEIKTLIELGHINVNSQKILELDPDGNAIALTDFPWMELPYIWLHDTLFQNKTMFSPARYPLPQRTKDAAVLASVMSHELYHYKNPPNIFCPTTVCIEGPGYQTERLFLRDLFNHVARIYFGEQKSNMLAGIYHAGVEREEEGFNIGALKGSKIFSHQLWKSVIER